MELSFYKRASRGIKHRATAMPFFYPRKPAAQVAPATPLASQQAAASGKVKQPAAATATLWSTMPAPPPSSVVAMDMEAVDSNGGDAADVDRRAAMYISRVQERLRRERMVEDWRMYY